MAACLAVIIGIAGIVYAKFFRGKIEDGTSSQSSASTTGYVPAQACAACHRSIWESYAKTGMARSFRRARAETLGEFDRGATLFHAASESHYTMSRRGDGWYQRRHQIGFDGKETNIVEKQIDYVVGSGNHARTYLHRKADGSLFELPVSWYSEKGGSWAMNPGYDRPDNEGFRRKIQYECLFCHTGYPQIKPGSDTGGSEPVFPKRIPEGIDCQRCHGPGEAHIRATASGKPEQIRAAIVNPARLSTDRQLEVCMQCHLETTSFRLPHAIGRYERGVFSYRPGEPLGDYQLQFDHEPGSGHDDKFEIAGHAYRLRKSSCFTASAGRLTCTTCHNPHDIGHGEKAMEQYNDTCRQCHASALKAKVASGKHTAQPGCIGCHMPKRRTDDVVHVVMTDHFIQRRKPARDLLAPLRERHETEETTYHGRVVLYYPADLKGPDRDLYLAVAQVKNSTNLKEGIPQLASVLERAPSKHAEPWLDLAEAYQKSGKTDEAIRVFGEALKRNQDFPAASIGLAKALTQAGRLEEARKALEQALAKHPNHSVILNDLGLVFVRQNKTWEAADAFRRSIASNPDDSEAHANLGAVLLGSRDPSGAEQAYRDAIRSQPDFATAHLELGDLIAQRGDAKQSDFHFKKALTLAPSAEIRYRYGLSLARREQFGAARAQFESAVQKKKDFAEAHASLGDMLAIEGKAAAAMEHYRRALSLAPELGSAHLGLGSLLASTGNIADGAAHLQIAARNADPSIREPAREQLAELAAKRRY